KPLTINLFSKNIIIMTTTFRFSRFLSVIRKYGSENKKLSLFSPVTLLVLLAIVFIFFLTASGETGYSREDAGSVKTTLENEGGKSDSEMMYRNIVTNGDAIRSVLQ
ncbi:MAG TPA: hypothetical protein VJ111_15275, partial [Chitinophagaceae bacterium]|nr:hypothetical protein [Chitinophagaceae bacterium]